METSSPKPGVTESVTVAEISRVPAALEILKAAGINHCCGAHLTLREAAAAAGVPLEPLISELEAATAPTAGLERVDLDVREDIRRGAEPFSRIMAAVKALPVDSVLVLRAPFEPIPLYGVLGKLGFAHATRCHAPGDWSISFYRQAGAHGACGSSHHAHDAAGDRATIDVRGLEPPQPLTRVLERLEALAAGEQLEVLHERHPMFLYPLLEERGFSHQTDEPEPGVVRLVIQRRAP